MDHWKGFWRVALVDECYLPSSEDDKCSRISLYAVLCGLFKAVEQEADLAKELFAKSEELIAAGILPVDRPIKVADMIIVDSP